ncbi:MAG: VOC family protein [Nostocales cyanobacterium ELA583]|jgi:catechol 2,3-dioxygenase-like lactoylglutathione lyase family enzyme
MIQKLQRLIVGLLFTVFLAIGFSTPVYAQSGMSREGTPVESRGYVYRVNVSDVKQTLTFYRDILGMELDKLATDCPPSPREKCWLEFRNRSNSKIGAFVSPNTGTGSAVITIVVGDVNTARNYLESKGIEVSPIQDAGKRVRLAFFSDFDGNNLAIRDDRGRE